MSGLGDLGCVVSAGLLIFVTLCELHVVDSRYVLACLNLRQCDYGRWSKVPSPCPAAAWSIVRTCCVATWQPSLQPFGLWVGMYRLKCMDNQIYLAMFPHNITYINKMNQERERDIYIYYMMDIYIYLAFEGEKGYSELLWVWTPSGTIEITCLFLNCRVWAMPSSKPCPGLIQGYLDQFGRFPELRQRGFSFLIDCSGRLFTAKKPSLKDIEGNIEAAETVGKISVYCHAFKNHVVDLQTILGPFSPWIWGPETVEKGNLQNKATRGHQLLLALGPCRQ